MKSGTKPGYKSGGFGQKNLFDFSDLRAAHSSPLDRTITDFGFEYLRPHPIEGALRCAFSLRRAVAEIRV
jgi:hypothetical protein